MAYARTLIQEREGGEARPGHGEPVTNQPNNQPPVKLEPIGTEQEEAERSQMPASGGRVSLWCRVTANGAWYYTLTIASAGTFAWVAFLHAGVKLHDSSARRRAGLYGACTASSQPLSASSAVSRQPMHRAIREVRLGDCCRESWESLP
jgi:hypothetical protein